MSYVSARRMSPFDLEPRGRLSMAGLLRHLQDTADLQVETFRLRLADVLGAGRQWVITEFTVEVDRALGAYEPFTVETWVAEGSRGIRAMRDWRVRDGAGVECGRAKSTWVMLDRATRRPVTPGLEGLTPEPGVDLVWPRVGLSPVEGEGIEFPVVWTDLDINHHANNVRYFEWMLAAAPEEWLRGREPRQMDIKFQREAGLGITVRSRVEVRGDSELAHQVVDGAGVSLALGRSVWV